MGLDDPFDDIFADNAAENNTRAGGKFQPKAKRGPMRKAATVPSSTSSQPVETGDSAQNESSIAFHTEKPLDPQGLIPTKDERCLESVNHVEDAVSKECVNPSNADIFLGLESLADFLPHSKAVVENSDPLSETPAIPASQNAEDRLASPVISHVIDSSCLSIIADFADDPTSHRISPAQDPLTDGQPIVSVDERGCCMRNGRLENQQIGSYSHVECLGISDLTAISGEQAGKFQPKPKIQIHKERTEASTVNPGTMETVMGQMNAHMDPSELEYVDKGLGSASPQDDVLDFPSLGLDHSIPTKPMSELPADKQPGDLTEASLAEASTHKEHIEAVPEMHEKIATERAKTGEGRNISSSDLFPDQENILTSNQGNEAGRVLRPRRKRNDGRRLVDVFEDKEPNGEFSAHYPGRSVASEANDDDFQVENELEVKKHRRKSNKAVGEKEKPVIKRKRAGGEPDLATAVRPKKFSHSTRRKRRLVDKVLLETPEDEIDFQKVPLRDLIILADYKERIAKKQAARSEAHLNSQSAGITSTHCNEAEGFPSELGEAAYDGQESPRFQEDSSYINYQTYMDKTPRARWLDADTELFYKAMYQLGVNLSMISHLFPGRTREQIMRKYRKEKRRHPSLLDEALTPRTNDCSCYKLLIERLQQIHAENKENSNKDESISLVDDEEAEQIPETNEETAKSERQTEQGAEDGLSPDVPVRSPLKDYESEGDLFDWSEYKSEV